MKSVFKLLLLVTLLQFVQQCTAGETKQTELSSKACKQMRKEVKKSYKTACKKQGDQEMCEMFSDLKAACPLFKKNQPKCKDFVREHHAAIKAEKASEGEEKSSDVESSDESPVEEEPESFHSDFDFDFDEFIFQF